MRGLPQLLISHCAMPYIGLSVCKSLALCGIIVSRSLISDINALQDYTQTVLDTADSIVNGVDGVDALLDQVETVLNVDVNVTDISNGITVCLLHDCCRT